LECLILCLMCVGSLNGYVVVCLVLHYFLGLGVCFRFPNQPNGLNYGVFHMCLFFQNGSLPSWLKFDPLKPGKPRNEILPGKIFGMRSLAVFGYACFQILHITIKIYRYVPIERDFEARVNQRISTRFRSFVLAIFKPSTCSNCVYQFN
jgi:hypothetical protein